jgi:hypothetical protein
MAALALSRSPLLAALLVLALGNAAGSQEPLPPVTPEVSGSAVVEVVDPSGAVVSGATVSVLNRSTGFRATVQTGADGRAKLTALPPGDYQVTTSLAGFATSKSRLALQVGAVQTLRVVLALGGPLPPETGGPSAPGESPPSTSNPPESPPGSDFSLFAETKTFDDETQVQEYLNKQLESNRSVISVIPLGFKKSIFVMLAGNESVTYTAMLVAKAINPTDLANRLSQHPGSSFLGIHRLSGSSYVLVLRK